MYMEPQWMEIKSLSASGHGIRAIARTLNISRNMVRRALRGKSSPPEEKTKRLFSKVLPFKEDILRMVNQELIGTRIVYEIRKLGYTGGNTSVYLYLQDLYKNTPRHPEKVSYRFETLPGIQGQFDWSPYQVSLGGVITRVIVFDLILAYSRRKFYWPSLNETQEAAFEAIERGLSHFGGAPTEILVDNARVFVKDPRPSHFEWNPHFADFCKHYGMVPKACQIRRSRTKGKVENPFFYLEQHFIKGREFLDFADFTRKLSDFNVELDFRVHQTLGVHPIERFELEKDALQPLPPNLFFGTGMLFRKVSWDCLISFNGSRYSVPFAFAGKEVSVKVSQGVSLEVFSRGGEKLASHKLCPRKGAIVIDESHYEGLRKQSPRTLTNLKKAFLESFPQESLFMEKLLAQYKWNAHAHLRNILELAALFPVENIREAFSLAMSYNTFSSHFIRGVLEKNYQVKTETSSIQTMVSIPQVHFNRGLRDYNKLISIEGSEK